MQPLSRVLDATLRAAEQNKLSNDTSLTPSHGSTNNDGRTTTVFSKGSTLSAEIKPQKYEPQPIKLSETWGYPLKDSDSATKRRIADFLVQTFMTLDTYGRSPSQFTSIVKMFFLILDDVPVVLIEKAFERYLRSCTEFPKPAHILDIIHNLEPGVRYNRMIREGR